LLLIIGTAFFLGPLLVRHILPGLASGFVPVKTSLFATFFVSLTHMLGQSLMTIRNQSVSVAVAILAIIALPSLNAVGLLTGLGLLGVATAASAAYSMSLLSRLGSAFATIGQPASFVSLVNVIGLAAIYTFTLLFRIDEGLGDSNSGVIIILGMTLAKLVLFLVLCLPMFFYANHRTRVISTVVSMVRERILR
jgi:hypothetical protein